jgi:hypothetical protein
MHQKCASPGRDDPTLGCCLALVSTAQAIVATGPAEYLRLARAWARAAEADAKRRPGVR